MEENIIETKANNKTDKIWYDLNSKYGGGDKLYSFLMNPNYRMLQDVIEKVNNYLFPYGVNINLKFIEANDNGSRLNLSITNKNGFGPCCGLGKIEIKATNGKSYILQPDTNKRELGISHYGDVSYNDELIISEKGNYQFVVNQGEPDACYLYKYENYDGFYEQFVKNYKDETTRRDV